MSTEPLSREPTPAPAEPPPGEAESASGRAEPAASLTESAPGQAEPARCGSCGAPTAPNQRYCLECGERLAPISDFLLGERAGDSTAPSPPSAPPVPPGAQNDPGRRSGLLVALAGVGVLLLAMGVGVLIGRAGNSRPAAAAVRVITEPGAGAASSAGAEAPFASDWPAGKSGYTVQLRTLPSAGTSSAAVAAAKAAATAKGASAVGALDSEEFSSLPHGNYVIYSGVYGTRALAQKALSGLHGSFPGASVIHVAGGARGGGGSGSGGAASSSGGAAHVPPSSLSHPAPPTVLKKLNKKGKSYEEESKNLPNVVETG